MGPPRAKEAKVAAGRRGGEEQGRNVLLGCVTGQAVSPGYPPCASLHQGHREVIAAEAKPHATPFPFGASHMPSLLEGTASSSCCSAERGGLAARAVGG